MIPLSIVFWLFVIIFAVIGSMRGWAKEILVTFSVILALFILQMMNFFAPIKNLFAPPNGTVEFWIRTGIVLIMVIVGYSTPNVVRFASGKLVREKFSDALLGFFIGALNGYLIVGTIWWFMIDSGYPFKGIVAPQPPPDIVNYLPPMWLHDFALYFAIMISFIFLLVVFI